MKNNIDQNFNNREELIELFETYGSLLSVSQKQTFHLYYIEDLSLGEIAKVLATSRQAINDALKKARLKLWDFKAKVTK